jgi:hypothetical protein
MSEERLYLGGRLAAEIQQLRWMRISFAVVGSVTLATFAMAYSHWRDGWQQHDYLYLFTGVVWAAFMLVQAKIYRRRQERITRLKKQLEAV